MIFFVRCNARPRTAKPNVQGLWITVAALEACGLVHPAVVLEILWATKRATRVAMPRAPGRRSSPAQFSFTEMVQREALSWMGPAVPDFDSSDSGTNEEFVDFDSSRTIVFDGSGGRSS